MNLKKALTELAVKGGLEKTEANSLIEKLVGEIQADPTVIEKDLPDNMRIAYDGLMGFEGAKGNGRVKAYFIANAFDRLDKQIISDAEANGFTSDQVSQLLAIEQDTPKRVALFAEFLKEGKGKGTSEEAQKQIRELQAKLTEAEKAKVEEAEKVRAEWNKEREVAALQNHFGAYSWAEHYPADVRGVLAETTLNAKLSEAGAVRVYNPETKSFDLRNAKDTSLPFSLNNLPVSFKDFTDKLMAEKGYIKTDAGKSSNQGNEPKIYQGKTADKTQTVKSNPALAEAEKALEDQRKHNQTA